MRAVFGARGLVPKSTRGCCIPATCFLDKALCECSFLPVGVNPSISGVSGHWANVVQSWSQADSAVWRFAAGSAAS